MDKVVEDKYQHWLLAIDDQKIAWLTFDRKDSNTNTLNSPILLELEKILGELKASLRPQGLVIQSGKKNGFIAGADIEQFTKINNSAEATDLIRKGQLIFDKLEKLSFPTVAYIKGFCLGGGLELALACDYRIADDSLKTRLGLPEVKLGIHPGWGGTIRLPAIIGSIKAMDLILSGRTIQSKVAKRLGLIDAVVPERHAIAAICYYITARPAKKIASALHAIADLDIIRPILARVFRKKVATKANLEHYPAPYAVIDNWAEQGIKSTNAYIEEAKSIGRLIVTNSSQNLVRVFFLQERLKNISKNIKYKLEHIHVIGAGVMGGDIAAWCALQGLTVTLQDSHYLAIANTFKRANKLFTRKLKDKYLIQKAKDCLMPDMDGIGISIADVIIEAVVENAEVKQELFAKIEQQAKPDAILATNTSTIQLSDINKNLNNPGRLVGIHFFNPVAQMPLVEIVRDSLTNDDYVNKAASFVRKIDKLPLPVKSAPGFLVNRVLMPYLMESVELLEEGVNAVAIDNAALKFGMPMGPVELADTVGLDVCKFAAENLASYLGSTLPKRISEMVNKGFLGKKSGQGFYSYKKGKIIKPKLSNQYHAPDDLADRLILRMINEAIACLREGIVTEAALLDAGMIFGTGFAPFRGGPIKYIEEKSTNYFKNKLINLSKRYGDRFTPDPGWDNLDNII